MTLASAKVTFVVKLPPSVSREHRTGSSSESAAAEHGHAKIGQELIRTRCKKNFFGRLHLMSAQDETQCRKCDGHGCIEGKFCDCTCGQLLASQEKHVAVAYNHETGQKEVFVDRKHETVRSGETRRSMTEPNEIVGHKTFAEGDGFRHEPLTRGEADVLLAAVDNAKRERAERMPDEKAAVVALFEAWLRLKELGWHEGIYCPKDGSHFQAITLGSTGIFECVCEGEWPDCTWTIFSDRDAYPSSQAPALIKKGEKP